MNNLKNMSGMINQTKTPLGFVIDSSLGTQMNMPEGIVVDGTKWTTAPKHDLKHDSKHDSIFNVVTNNGKITYDSSDSTKYDVERINTIENARIAICGNIGSGKTTLVRNLTEWLKNNDHAVEPHYEPVTQGKFNRDLLSSFYSNIPKYGLSMQLNALIERTIQNDTIYPNNVIHVFDRCIYEDWCFAKNIYSSGLITKIEYDLYQKVYNFLNRFISPRYDVMVYLKCSTQTIMERIQQRIKEKPVERAMEKTITSDYIGSLNKQYDAVMEELGRLGKRVMIVDYNKFAKVEDIGNQILKVVCDSRNKFNDILV